MIRVFDGGLMRQARERSGQSVDEVAARTFAVGNRVTPKAIRDLEAGRCSNPHLRTVWAIAEAIGCCSSEFERLEDQQA